MHVLKNYALVVSKFIFEIRVICGFSQNLGLDLLLWDVKNQCKKRYLGYEFFKNRTFERSLFPYNQTFIPYMSLLFNSNYIFQRFCNNKDKMWYFKWSHKSLAFFDITYTYLDKKKQILISEKWYSFQRNEMLGRDSEILGILMCGHLYHFCWYLVLLMSFQS